MVHHSVASSVVYLVESTVGRLEHLMAEPSVESTDKLLVSLMAETMGMKKAVKRVEPLGSLTVA